MNAVDGAMERDNRKSIDTIGTKVANHLLARLHNQSKTIANKPLAATSPGLPVSAVLSDRSLTLTKSSTARFPPPPVPKAAATAPTALPAPVPPARSEVEAVLAEVDNLATHLPAPAREAAARLCDDARRIDTVEHAIMVRNCVAAFRPAPNPVTARTTPPAPEPDPEPPIMPPDPEFVALVAEARALAASESPVWIRTLEKEIHRRDAVSVRKLANGLREMARLRRAA